MGERLEEAVLDASNLLSYHKRMPLSIRGDGHFVHQNTPCPPFTVLQKTYELIKQLEDLVKAVEANG